MTNLHTQTYKLSCCQLDGCPCSPIQVNKRGKKNDEGSTVSYKHKAELAPCTAHTPSESNQSTANTYPLREQWINSQHADPMITTYPLREQWINSQHADPMITNTLSAGSHQGMDHSQTLLVHSYQNNVIYPDTFTETNPQFRQLHVTLHWSFLHTNKQFNESGCW